MKILFVHNNILGECGEAAMFYYPVMLAQLGHDVSILSRRGGNSQSYISKSVKVFDAGWNKNWLSFVSVKIEEVKPDIVHVFLYSGCGLIPLICKHKVPSKYVLDIRSPLLRTGLPRVLHRIKNIFEIMPFDAIATHGIESAWSQIGSRPKTFLLPPGVDFSIAPNKVISRLKDQHSFRCIYIGSLDKLRKIDQMLSAFALVSKQCPFELDIYGNGSDLSKLQGMVTDMNLSDCVRFLGTIPRESLLGKIPEYDLGLSYVPSGIYDAAPALKTLEYLACGVPVLATNTHGNRMFVESGFNGYIAEEDPVSFSKGIMACVDKKDLYKLRHNTRCSVEEYDWMRIVKDRLQPIYSSL